MRVLGGALEALKGMMSFRDSGARTQTPAVVFLSAALALVVFGLLMIYSASSIMGIFTDDFHNNPAYYFIQQGLHAGGGCLCCALIAAFDYHYLEGLLLRICWGAMVLVLVAMIFMGLGRNAYGATRWVAVGGASLQPSEFAKVLLIVVGACLLEDLFEGRGPMGRQTVLTMFVGLGIPLLLIFLQPDKGSTGILLLTLLVMAYLAGVPGPAIIGVVLLALVLGLGIASFDEYALKRMTIFLDPFKDEFDTGFQLVQSFYAFGSGGLTGVGLGMGRQKYSYLPMVHNDFILASVGEELGFVGVVCVLAVFCVLLWAGLKVAESAGDMRGRLIAGGATALIMIQLLLNVSGVVGAFPLSGKPVPFLSYGGSSIVSSLMLVGLVMSVSLHSPAPEESYVRRRAALRLAGEDEGQGSVGARRGVARRRGAVRPSTPVPQSAPTTLAPRSVELASSRGWVVVDGGRRDASPSAAGGRGRDGGWGRTDLGESKTERLLRGRSGARRP